MKDRVRERPSLGECFGVRPPPKTESRRPFLSELLGGPKITTQERPSLADLLAPLDLPTPPKPSVTKMGGEFSPRDLRKSFIGKSVLFIAPISKFEIEADTNKATTQGWASTGDLDRDNEIIEPTAWTKSMVEYMKNPVVRFMHQEPVGKTVNYKITERGLWVKTEIIPTDRGKDVWKLVKEGVVKSYSIAGKIMDEVWKRHSDLGKDIRHITGLDLYEISLVDVPANPQAIIEAIGKSDFKDPIVIKRR